MCVHRVNVRACVHNVFFTACHAYTCVYLYLCIIIIMYMYVCNVSVNIYLGIYDVCVYVCTMCYYVYQYVPVGTADTSDSSISGL